MPAKGEPLALADIAETNDDPRVQKALRRLAEDMAPSRVSQLVMWHVSAGLDWNTIAQLSDKWVNRYELTLAQDFVARLDTKSAGESAKILFEVSGTDGASEAMAAELSRTLQNKMVLGLLADNGIPPRPTAPAVACRVKLNDEHGAGPGLLERRRGTKLGRLRQVQRSRQAGQGEARRLPFLRGDVGGNPQSPGPGTVEQGGQGQGQDALRNPNRKRIAPCSERPGGSGRREQGGRSAQVLGGYLHLPAPKLDGAGE